MKVSVNWIKSIVDSEQTSANLIPKDINELVEKIGAQLGAVEEVVNVGNKYQGIVIVKVVECQRHPNADKLSVCLIDDGGKVKGVKRDKNGLVVVVCGAPNVASGQLVVWMPPGVAVPASFDKDPLVLEAREIRGVISNGMIASPKELGISDEHEGILVIEPDTMPQKNNRKGEVKHTEFFRHYKSIPLYKAGDDFAKTFGFDDYIIDIENKMFTHRPDCFGMLGIARELAGIQHLVFRSPKWYLGEKTTGNHKTDDKLLVVMNEIPVLVPRFTLQIIKNVKVYPSSVEIQADLARVGVRPINNIVDATNHLMLVTAQPIHAYDYDKVKRLSSVGSARIVVRKAKKGEELVLLGGKEITLEGDEVVIATDKEAIGLGGVMGGAETEVDENTKNIILEVGNFDMNSTRLTAMHHGLFTDAATRFTKNQSPWQNDRVLARTIDEIVHEAGGMPARTIYDLKGRLTPPPRVRVTANFINERLGLGLSAKAMAKLLENVEFKVQVNGDSLNVTAPFWRTDIEIPEDIVEEVGRLYGYDHLPLELPPRDLTPAKPDSLIGVKSRLREALYSAGANEILTYSFVHGSLLEAAGQDAKDAYHIRNALSPDLQYYRLSLVPSLLEKVHPNVKARFDNFTLFEIGTSHVRGVEDTEKLPAELLRLSVAVVSTGKNQESGAPFYNAKYYIGNLLNKLSIKDIEYQLLEPAKKLTKDWRIASAAFEPKRTAALYSGDKFLGLVGEPSVKLTAALKLPADTSVAELDIGLLHVLAGKGLDYRPLNRYPSLEQDVTLRSSVDLTYAALTGFLQRQLAKAAKDHAYGFNIKPLAIFQAPKDKKHKQTSWRISFWHPQRTLTTGEVNKLLDRISVAAVNEIKAERI
ncbi:phenylalanine--tRNA ligase subunit beta [Candidatus Saccharibacteria bacterium]|nr:phenylalanine--tRNA ligase subunit beta [Candidatus Saccharibacteria bacterium]